MNKSFLKILLNPRGWADYILILAHWVWLSRPTLLLQSVIPKALADFLLALPQLGMTGWEMLYVFDFVAGKTMRYYCNHRSLCCTFHVPADCSFIFQPHQTSKAKGSHFRAFYRLPTYPIALYLTLLVMRRRNGSW